MTSSLTMSFSSTFHQLDINKVDMDINKVDMDINKVDMDINKVDNC